MNFLYFIYRSNGRRKGSNVSSMLLFACYFMLFITQQKKPE